MSEAKKIVVVDAPPEFRRFNETIRNAGVRFYEESGRKVTEAQELYTLVFDDITHLHNSDPTNALVTMQRGPSRDRYADFGDLRNREPWGDFEDSYKRFSFGMLAEMQRKFGVDPNKTLVYERHAQNYVLFSVYDEAAVAARYDGR
jgi:hypothetical protein